MKTFVVLWLTLLAVSLTQASVTYRQLLQLAKPADSNTKADHKIQLGELDDEVDFQSILKQMGHEFNVDANGDAMRNNAEQHGEINGIKTHDGTNADLDENVKAGQCACYGKTCVCCCVLTFTYEGKQYYIELCVRVTYVRASVFLVELFLQGSRVRYVYVSRPTNVDYIVSSNFKVGCMVYYVSSNKICFYLYFVVNGKVYKCENHCLEVSASHLGLNLEQATN